VNGHGSPGPQHLPYVLQVVQVSDDSHVCAPARGESAGYGRQTTQIFAYLLLELSPNQYPMSAGSVEAGACRMKTSGAGVMTGSTPKLEETSDSIVLPGVALGVIIMTSGFGNVLE
jgi:hypothetical protein